MQLHERDGFWEQVVRKITNKGTKKCIGKFPSMKAGRNVWYESTIERDFIYLLEFDPDVVRYKEQPFRVKYTYDGKRRSYVPDFFVQRGDKFQVVDNKPGGKAITAANKLRYRIFRSIFREQGYEFIIATDLQIRIEPLLGNVKTFWRYARTPVHPLQEVRCQEYLSERGETSIQELADTLAPRGVTLQVVYALLHRGILATEMRRPVNPEAVVYFSSVNTPAYARTITQEA